MPEWILLPTNNGLPSLVAAIVCLVVAFRYTTVFSSHKRLQDKSQDSTTPCTGGEAVPIIDGNTLYHGRTKWPQYEARFNLRLSYLYGPVVCIKTQSNSRLGRLLESFNRWLYPTWRPSHTTVLINSLEGDDGTLKQLLNSCASRADSIAAGKYLSRGRRIVLQPYGPEWVRQRKAFAMMMTKQRIEQQWTEALRSEAMELVDRISRLSKKATPCGSRLVDEVTRFTASSVLQITYARRAPTPDDPVLKDLEVVSGNIASAFTPGQYWVEKMPLLDIFPAIVSPWKRTLNAHHDFESTLFSRLLQTVEERMSGKAHGGSATQSVIPVEDCGAALLLRNENHGLDRDRIVYLAAGLFEAGTETTAMTINTFLLAAACYPEYVQRAREEIDKYMYDHYGGQAAVPDFKDLAQLRILAALVKETLRLTPTGSSGVGHTPTSGKPLSLSIKCKHRGAPRRLDIPSGATILGNIYGLHHDAAMFPDPWRFNPGRWLSPELDDTCLPSPQPARAASCNSLDHTHATFAFGFGRRICPGAALASYSLTIAIALLLYCFEFELTDTAKTLCNEMDRALCDENEKWAKLFPMGGGLDALKREQSSRAYHEDERDRTGRILLDAYTRFKLSREQLNRCIRLNCRKDGDGLRAVQCTLSRTSSHAGVDR